MSLRKGIGFCQQSGRREYFSPYFIEKRMTYAISNKGTE